MSTHPPSRLSGFAPLLALAAALLLFVPSAFARQGHGWFVVETKTKENATRATVIHLPPTDRLTPPGSYRVAQGFTRAPERIAWTNDTVYLMMSGELVAENELARRIYAISAVPGIMAGWEYIPGERPETLPTLAGPWGDRDLQVAGLAATPAGPVVLMKGVSEATPNGGYLLLVLQGTNWVRANPVWGVDSNAELGTISESQAVTSPDPLDRCRLVTTAEGFGLLLERHDNSPAQWCVASARTEPTTDPDVASLKPVVGFQWQVRTLTSDPPAAPDPKTDLMYCVEEQLLRVTISGSECIVSVLRPSDEFVVKRFTDLPNPIRIAPVQGQSGFLALLCGDVPSAAPAAGPAPGLTPDPDIALQLIELTPNGKVLYDGPARSAGAVTNRQVQFLSLLLMIVMAAIIIFVLRPSSARLGEATSLPPGLAFAEPGRRVVATMFDLGIGWLVAMVALRMNMSDLAMVDGLIGTPKGWLAMGVTILAAFVLGSFMEWQWGATLGKLLLGCRVLSIDIVIDGGGDDDPKTARKASRQIQTRGGVTFRQALLRNASKWMPWTIAGFLASNGTRSWADRVSGTGVFIRVVPPPSDGEQ